MPKPDNDAAARAAPSPEAMPRFPEPSPLVRRHVFSLDSGHAALELPAQLSPDVLEDIKAWLVVMVRRAGKSAKQGEAGDAQPAAGADVRDLLDAFFPEPDKRAHA